MSRSVHCKYHKKRSLFISESPGLHPCLHSTSTTLTTQRRSLVKSHRRVVDIILTRALSLVTLMATCHRIGIKSDEEIRQRFSEEPGSGDPTAVDLAVISSHRPGFTYLTILHATSADESELGLSAQ